MMIVCEFCYETPPSTKVLPIDWGIVLQSYVCPECQVKVKSCGGYEKVIGGAFATIPDPRNE